MQIDLAVIGGSGFYDWPELQKVEQLKVSTEYGEPSAPLTVGYLEGKCLAFMPRHGLTHSVPPHAINYRANIAALKSLGVTEVVGVNAVGGIHADMLAAAHLVVPDQIIDYSHGRITSFFDLPGDAMAHIDFTEPYCRLLRAQLKQAIEALELPGHFFATYGCTQGPRLETKAEIARLERDGCDIVGMTGMPEAGLAREAGLNYACLSTVVNPAAGKSDSLIEMSDIEKAMILGVSRAKQVLQQLFATLKK